MHTVEKLPLYVLGFFGPNGSGKTTVIDVVREHGLYALGNKFSMPSYFINPDQVSKDLKGQFTEQDELDRAAFNQARAMRRDAIEMRKDFAFESVASHPSRLAELMRLKEQGYCVLIVFITTDSPEKNVDRVAKRVISQTTTGHYVKPQKVRDRYHRTLALLPKVAEIADASFVYDNSIDFQIPSPQATIDGDKFSVISSALPWVHDRLISRLQSREKQFNGIAVGMNLDNGHDLQIADALRGNYSGRVTHVLDDYIVTLDEAMEQSIIHDRLMLDTAEESHPDGIRDYQIDEYLLVEYSIDNAPIVTRYEPDYKQHEEDH